MQELPQEASPDLELSDIGEPIHEFDMKVYILKNIAAMLITEAHVIVCAVFQIRSGTQ